MKLPKHFNGFRNAIVDVLSRFLPADRVADYCVAFYDEKSKVFEILEKTWLETQDYPEISAWEEIDGLVGDMVVDIARQMKESNPWKFYEEQWMNHENILYSWH